MQRHLFAKKRSDSQSYDFFSSHVWMWELDHKAGWGLKNWSFWIVVLEKTLESPFNCKEIKLVNPKGKSTLNIYWKDWCWSWSSSLWVPDSSQLTGKDPDAGKDWRLKEKGAAEISWLDGITDSVDMNLSKPW